ncbi:EF-hand calcium-binding domain-containing protein 14 isoform X1 [Monodelphis domestica]|uniref:EF-hand calcium-binding domain-containing protein 14 isoform X1 n=1 Tax=Monodelphis domestica TaxID=13616 RepID=UPI0024E1DECA|nr:EF-hand calcium-binding domain-containing protein 14 isoform X1 [Monodelphis domestica]
MKKRRELNALIGLGPGDGRTRRSRRSRRRAWKSAAGHRLLRTEPPASGSASSSEDEDDDDDDDDDEEDEEERGRGGPGGGRTRFARGDCFRCCKICYPLCAFVILAACVVACVGLVWMQVALKEDLDLLKEQFRVLESNQKSSFQEIPKLNEELLGKQKQLEKIESGDLGLSKVWINITEMTKQIALLTSTVNHLKTNIKSASDLISLPATVEGLQKSVASIGSTLNSVRLAVEAVQKTVDEHKKTIETLQNDMIQHFSKETSESIMATPSPSMAPGLAGKSQRENFQQDVLHLQSSLEEVNNTLVGYQRQNDLKLLGMDGTVRNLTQRVNSIESSLVALNKLGKRENLAFTMMADGATSLKRDSPRTDGEEDHIQKKEDSPNSQASKLREKVQLINALTGKSEPNRPPENSEEGKTQSAALKPSASPKFSPRSLGAQGEKAAHLRPVSIPGISSLTDLLDLFQRMGRGPEGKLSYQDLQHLLGPAIPSAQSLAELDMDRDGSYSFPELRLALGIEHMEQN